MATAKKKTITAAAIDSALERLEASKELNTAEVREIKNFPIGKHVRQGDVYILRVADNAPRGKETFERQLAQGNTQGSRHMAVGTLKCFQPSTDRPAAMLSDARAYLPGPLVVATKEWSVTHPEHAHYKLPAGTYQIMHQLDPRTMQRVAD